jgi:lipoxygenase
MTLSYNFFPVCIQAIDEKRLFIIDYHDVYLPFVNKINEMKDRKLYASRTIFFLTDLGTLTPVAIELSLPPSSSTSQSSKRVFTPGQDATGHWFWQLAKAHATSNDVGFHQLVNHWYARSHMDACP